MNTIEPRHKQRGSTNTRQHVHRNHNHENPRKRRHHHTHPHRRQHNHHPPRNPHTRHPRRNSRQENREPAATSRYTPRTHLLRRRRGNNQNHPATQLCTRAIYTPHPHQQHHTLQPENRTPGPHHQARQRKHHHRQHAHQPPASPPAGRANEPA